MRARRETRLSSCAKIASVRVVSENREMEISRDGTLLLRRISGEEGKRGIAQGEVFSGIFRSISVCIAFCIRSRKIHLSGSSRTNEDRAWKEETARGRARRKRTQTARRRARKERRTTEDTRENEKKARERERGEKVLGKKGRTTSQRQSAADSFPFIFVPFPFAVAAASLDEEFRIS